MSKCSYKPMNTMKPGILARNFHCFIILIRTKQDVFYDVPSCKKPRI